jgi:CDP-diacylglycerol--glycerol-3-phosphate 3-phosphatidyltransferase
MGDPETTAGVVNVANALTVVRLVLVPVFAYALLYDGGHSTAARWTAFVIFAVATLTDLADGAIARRRHLVTAFGKVADPIADKALVGTALVGLSLLGRLPWWVTVVILAREIGVTLLRVWVIRHGVIPASRGGKLKTALQSVAIAGLILPTTGVALVLVEVVMGAAVVVTLATGVDYVAKALALRARAAAGGH